MRYMHYYTQKASVPEEQWAAFKSKLKLAFNNLPDSSTSAGGFYKDCPITLCYGPGKQGVRKADKLFVTGQGNDFTGEATWFNGDRLVGHEAQSFILPNVFDPENQKWMHCNTECKPYDWFVVTALILIHHEAPGCFEISSDGRREHWEPVIRWLAPVVGHELTLPQAVDGVGERYYPDSFENRLVGLPSFHF
ncbi:hypothetical protein [Halomonas sp. C05BenzN]|uniref:hypothetical protein n=1 Tax=Halomonas sp. C05BenzN TaxID=3411041 RepID=UPI003B94E68C